MVGWAEQVQAPRHFGRYEVIARVASGGMGTVFLSRAHGEGGFNRLFTLKVLHAHLSSNSEFISLMQREARIAARLHHPNIVPIVDVGHADDVFYIVMDYVEGCTFADLLNHHLEYRPPAVIVAALLDALNGLHAAHELVDEDGKPLNLVHRDLSPENMLLGVDGHCRLIDFGIAKGADPVQLTKPGVVRGKPAYMSPEHVTGTSLDRRSDLFSMGVVLFNALTGKRLFDGASPHATMYNVLKRNVPKPSLIGLRPPACFDALVLKALERDPFKRFQSAEEMSDALRSAALAGGYLGTGADVAKLVTSSFGAKLEERRQRTREFVRARDAAAPATLHTLPELTLSASGLQPVLTPSRTEQHQLLTWDELSREPDSVLVEPVVAASPEASGLAAEATHLSAPAPRWRRHQRVLLTALGGLAAVALVGIGYLLAGAQDDEPAALQGGRDNLSAQVRSSLGDKSTAETGADAKAQASGVSSADTAAPRPKERAEREPNDRPEAPEKTGRDQRVAEPTPRQPGPARNVAPPTNAQSTPAPPRIGSPVPPPRTPVSSAAPKEPGPSTPKVETNPYLRAE